MIRALTILLFLFGVSGAAFASDSCPKDMDKMKTLAVGGSLTGAMFQYPQHAGFTAEHDICLEHTTGTRQMTEIATRLLTDSVDVVDSINAGVFMNNRAREKGSNVHVVVAGSLLPSADHELLVLSCFPQEDGSCKPYTRTRELLGQEIASGRSCAGQEFVLASEEFSDEQPKTYQIASSNEAADVLFRSQDLFDAVGDKLRVVCKFRADEAESLWAHTVYFAPIGGSVDRDKAFELRGVVGDIPLQPFKTMSVHNHDFVNPFANDTDRFTGLPLTYDPPLFAGMVVKADRLESEPGFRSKVERMKMAYDDAVKHLKDPASQDEFVAYLREYASQQTRGTMHAIFNHPDADAYFQELALTVRTKLLTESSCIDYEKIKSYALLSQFSRSDFEKIYDERYLCK